MTATLQTARILTPASLAGQAGEDAAAASNPSEQAQDAAALLAARLAEDTATVLREAVTTRGIAHLAVSGGSVATEVFPAVVARVGDWSHIHVWFVDERFVPAADPDRNALPVRAALKDAPGFDPAHLHEVPARDAGLTLAEAAAAYAAALGATATSFDLALLGMGPDGHTASIFPNRPWPAPGTLTATINDSPKPPPQRVTLTFDTLDAAARCWLFAVGPSKHDALRAALDGDVRLPIARVRARDDVRIYTDLTLG